MSWTTPANSPADGNPLPAAWLNTYVKANMEETVPAKAVAAGDLFVATGPNAIARLALGDAGQVLRVNAAGTGVEWVELWQEVIKQADESVSSSTTFQDDDELFIPVVAGTYIFEMNLITRGATAGDLKFTFTAPVAANSDGASIFVGTAAGGTVSQNHSQFGNQTTMDIETLNRPMGYVWGYVTTNGAGNLQLQWAQNASNGTPTIVAAGSRLRATRTA